MAKLHVVVNGETLGGIARRYGVAVADMVRWNRLRNPDRIWAGQVLRVAADAPEKPSPTKASADDAGGVGVPGSAATVGEPAWLRVARGEVGVKEVDGSGDRARIVEYHAATALASTQDEVAWCASFVGWCLREAGVEPTGSAAARSYERYGKKLDGPRVGCVVVLRRGRGWQGHVGFVVRWTGAYVDVLGGNQGDAVTVQRFSRARVLAWRWPTVGTRSDEVTG